MRLTIRPRPCRAAGALTACVVLAGCGISNPGATTTPRPAAAPAQTGARAPATVLDAQDDPLVRLAVEFTLTQATWSPDTYVTGRARLARISTGRARAQLAAPAGESSADVAAILKKAGSSSRATLIGTDGPNRRHQVVVAYKVVGTGAGRRPGRADYQLAHVTLTPGQGRWLISTFEIQP
jgi:hypothetical protein